MAIRLKDKEFRLHKVTPVDFKTIEMDRVLTNLFARIFHNGHESRLSRDEKKLLTIETFYEGFLQDAETFNGFDTGNNQEIAKRWIETHLLDLVSRGKAKQAVASPRPLHGFTYRFRNTRHCRDYGNATLIYELLKNARNGAGDTALKLLRDYFFTGIDPATGKVRKDQSVDVEAQALVNALNNKVVTQDAPKQNTRTVHQPVCVGSADLFTNDILGLLQYRDVIPRTVMVDYLKILIAFHLALYQLRLIKLLPRLVLKKGKESICEVKNCPVEAIKKSQPFGSCPHQIGLFLDVKGQPGGRIAELANRSADTHYRRIPNYIKAGFLSRKLDEMGSYLLKFGKLPGMKKKELTLSEVLGLQDNAYKKERDYFFQKMLDGVVEQATDDNGDGDAIHPEIQQVLDWKLDPMETFIECLSVVRGDYHKKFITNYLDSTMLKNRPGALVAQTRARGAPRRFVLDTRLLEVLLQLAVLKYEPGTGYQTQEIRIDELLDFLRDRYGLHIDSLPQGEGFDKPSIQDNEALRENREAFKDKLRDIGFFRDLSDAYITQNVSPRYRISQ
ncbi:hypothetical protein AAFN60_18585 [Roseibacillus persicicus]|uniref:methylation-associated defense system protein MAD7 n=1 Tax=Roseibacillus persicicus TaxID=454148 RepID=UPI00398AFC9D